MIYLNFSLYQNSGFVVNVVIIKVTPSIIGLDNASYTSIQSDVSFGISGEHQKVRGIWTPANLVLMYIDTEEGKTKMYVYIQFIFPYAYCEHMYLWVCFLIFFTLHTTACMTASNPPSGASLFLETLCFSTSSVKRATFSVSDSTCLNPN